MSSSNRFQAFSALLVLPPDQRGPEPMCLPALMGVWRFPGRPGSQFLIALKPNHEQRGDSPGQGKRAGSQERGGMDLLKYLWLQFNPQNTVKCFSLHLCSSLLGSLKVALYPCRLWLGNLLCRRNAEAASVFSWLRHNLPALRTVKARQAFPQSRRQAQEHPQRLPTGNGSHITRLWLLFPFKFSKSHSSVELLTEI